MEEDSWVDGFVTAASIKDRVEQMRRKQRLHDFHEKSPTMKEESSFVPFSFLATWCFMCFYVWDTVPPIFS